MGTAAIQLARRKKPVIYSTAGSEEKVAFLKELGVDFPINHRRTELESEIRCLAGRRCLDLILDPVGGKTLQTSYDLLAPLGRVVSYGLSAAVSGSGRNWLRALKAWLRTPRFSPLDLIQRNAGVFGFHLGLLDGQEGQVREILAGLLEEVEQEALAPIIAETFPLTQEGAIEAHRYLHDRNNIGKVLLLAE